MTLVGRTLAQPLEINVARLSAYVSIVPKQVNTGKNKISVETLAPLEVRYLED